MSRLCVTFVRSIGKSVGRSVGRFVGLSVGLLARLLQQLGYTQAQKRAYSARPLSLYILSWLVLTEEWLKITGFLCSLQTTATKTNLRALPGGAL